MKNPILTSILLFSWLIVGVDPSHAFYLPESVDYSHPEHSPYPYVLSPAIDALPQGFDTINVGEDTYYYSKGTFFKKVIRDQKYIAVPPPIGAVVFNIPDGYQLILMDGISYYEYGGVYYKRVLDGYKVIYPLLL